MRRLLAAFIVLLSCSSAHAAVICVRPTQGVCVPTIQMGVARAAAGDTVLVAPGVYFENVVVPPGKDGLSIVGAGPRASILDPDAPNTGTGIRIESSGVSVRRLGIRNGRLYAIEIAAGVSDVVVRDLRIVATRGPAAVFAGTGATRLQIASNEIHAAGRIGIHLSGDNHDSVIKGNALTQVDRAIVAAGDGLQVKDNAITGATSAGLSVLGGMAVVAENMVDNVLSGGLVVTGLDPVVRHNRLRLATASISCTTCSGGDVSGNSLFGGSMAGAPGHGMQIHADARGLVVHSNRSRRVASSAFEVSGHAVELTSNVASEAVTGFRLRDTFDSPQGEHVLRVNTATNIVSTGFGIETSRALLEQNVALRAGGSGFLLSGTDDNVLRGNRAVGSTGPGFAVVSGHNVLVGNSGERNRYDFCDDGFETIVSDNAFDSISTVCDVF